ncbi:hypothetical protein JTE90_015841 [Oedothorax gibbosus]|uniref:Uncharacterized protein n=1 Tax=Oedothorax gibbosus TaxID=931172 RepID=A0AAV6VU70_9ARAC|nr:hypothetical protein JTE90_015841 [Oedothorax gibbosus]
MMYLSIPEINSIPHNLPQNDIIRKQTRDTPILLKQDFALMTAGLLTMTKNDPTCFFVARNRTAPPWLDATGNHLSEGPGSWYALFQHPGSIPDQSWSPVIGVFRAVLRRWTAG